MVASLPHGNTVPGARLFAKKALDNLLAAHNAIIDSRVHQTFHAKCQRCNKDVAHGEEHKLKPGDKVYLSTTNLNIPKSWARKLIPRYVSPYAIIEGDSLSSAYFLDLSTDLVNRGIHPWFHISLLRRYEPNDNLLFPRCDAQAYYDLGEPDETEWLVDEILSNQWIGRTIEFKVKWNYGDMT